MTKGEVEEPYYGYNVVKCVFPTLIGCGVASIALAVIFTMLTCSTWVLILCWASGVILLVSGVFWHLSVGWINNPEKVKLIEGSFVELLRTVWDGKGKVLDIGTGLGRTAIRTAKRFPEGRVIGVDTWTKRWRLFGMTKARAEENARIENVSDRCCFRNGNALHLPFEDAEFQLVVSSFAFHEVKAPDRTVLFKEALRVLVPGGAFVILDLFPKGYRVRDVQELLKKVEGLGVKDVKLMSLKERGVRLGGLAHIWGIGYLSGRKVSRS